MNLDYEKLAREVDIELSLSSNTWPTPAEFQNAAKRVISASGLLEEVERLRSNLINAVNALENVGRHKGLLAGERAALEDAKAALNSPLNPEGLRDQTGIENKAWKE